MTTCTIREATRADLDPLYEIFSEADSLHRAVHPEIFQKARHTNTLKEYYKTCILDPSMAIFVAEQNDLICGAIICTLHSAPDNPILVPRKYGTIENIVVLSAHQRQGIGKHLMKRAHQWANAMEATSVELTVWDFNQGAQDFYRGLGYIPKHLRMTKELP